MRFSVIIPTRNRRRYLVEAIDSVLAQTRPAWETIVVDDASSDQTGDLRDHHPSRIRWIRHRSPKGAEVARNTGAGHATGTHLVFLDDDDLLHPQALAVYARMIEESDPGVILARQLEFEDGDDLTRFRQPLSNRLSVADYKHLLLKEQPVKPTASILVVNRSVFESVGGFSIHRSTFPLEDLDFMLRAGCSGRALQILAPATVAYRIHPSNAVRQSMLGYRAILSILSNERRGLYPGGAENRIPRYRFIGQVSLTWVRRLLRVKPMIALHLVACSLPMALAALADNVHCRIRRGRSVRLITLNP